jgi:hypothetical protein
MFMGYCYNVLSLSISNYKSKMKSQIIADQIYMMKYNIYDTN